MLLGAVKTVDQREEEWRSARKRNAWIVLAVVEAGLCGDLAGVHSGYHPMLLNSDWGIATAMLWWGLYFIGYGLVAISFTLSLAAAYYAIFD